MGGGGQAAHEALDGAGAGVAVGEGGGDVVGQTDLLGDLLVQLARGLGQGVRAVGGEVEAEGEALGREHGGDDDAQAEEEDDEGAALADVLFHGDQLHFRRVNPQADR